VESNLQLAAAAGASSLLRVFPLPEGRPEASLPDGKFVLACPLAGWGSKQWPFEFYADVAQGLDMPLVVNGPPASAALLARIEGAHIHLSGIAGLIDATRRAHAVIGVDSGPMHLAAALLKPGVAIFGPTDPASHGPYCGLLKDGGLLKVLRDPHAITSYKRRAEPDPSMLAIEPYAVLEALKERTTGCTA
jgi:heptosyltransferase-1